MGHAQCGHRRVDGLALADGSIGVVDHQAHAEEIDRAADGANDVEGNDRLDALDEAVGQRTISLHGAPHQPFGHTSHPQRGDVEHHADGRRPEVDFDEALAPHLSLAPQARNQVVQAAHGDHAHPAHGAGMHMADDPVGVVTQRAHRLDGEHRPFEGGHAVERQRGDQELEDGIFAQLVPGARQSHHAVDHATPARRQQDEREHHPQRLRPVGQRGVQQVVRAGPHISEDQRPKVHDGQAVRIDRALGLLGDEVVHHAQEGGGEEEAHGVVAVPPLDHRVLRAAVHRVALPRQQADGQLDVVDDVEQRNGDDVGAEEPVRHIDVRRLPLHDGAEKHHGIRHPGHDDQQADRPFLFSVFLAAGDAQRIGDGAQHDDRRPSPEGELSQLGREQRHLTSALHDVVRGREQRRTAKTENHRIGVQWTQTPPAQPLHAVGHVGKDQLHRNEHANQHAHHGPNQGHDGEFAHQRVVVSLFKRQIAHLLHLLIRSNEP